MKKLLKGILVVFGVAGLVVVLGMVATLFMANEAIEAVDESIQVMEQESQEETIVIDELVQAIQWEFSVDGVGDVVATGVLENTTNEAIDYIEIAYEFVKDGVTIEESFTNATEIEPNEKVQIEIITCIQEFDEFNVKGSNGWE